MFGGMGGAAHLPLRMGGRWVEIKQTSGIPLQLHIAAMKQISPLLHNAWRLQFRKAWPEGEALQKNMDSLACKFDSIDLGNAGRLPSHIFVNDSIRALFSILGCFTFTSVHVWHVDITCGHLSGCFFLPKVNVSIDSTTGCINLCG